MGGKQAAAKDMMALPATPPVTNATGENAPGVVIVRPALVLEVCLSEPLRTEVVTDEVAYCLECYRLQLRDVEAAARILTAGPRSSLEQRAAAHDQLAWFMDEMLKFDDNSVRRGFDHRVLDRLDRFPIWPALISELVSGRWRRFEVGQHLAYLREALRRDAFRYYRDGKYRLRKRDSTELPGGGENDFPEDRIGTTLRSEDGYRPHRRHGLPCGNPAIPPAMVRHDMSKLLHAARAEGMPRSVATLLWQRFLNYASDAEIGRRIGWTENQVESVQTALRCTWSGLVERVFMAGGYQPSAPGQAWKKFRKLKSDFGKILRKSPSVQ